MPRKATDYEKALIYKICCLDPNVKEIYVGSTTDIIRRRYNHKTACNNPNVKGHNYKVYQHIRQHGGWDNWNLVLIEYFPCKTELELGKNEDHWKQELQASLNSITPPMYATKKEYCVANREELAENAREYYEVHRQQIREKQNAYKEANREEINKKKDEKHICECGGKFTQCNKSKHEKSKIHQKHLEEKNKINKISA